MNGGRVNPSATVTDRVEPDERSKRADTGERHLME